MTRKELKTIIEVTARIRQEASLKDVFDVLVDMSNSESKQEVENYLDFVDVCSGVTVEMTKLVATYKQMEKMSANLPEC